MGYQVAQRLVEILLFNKQGLVNDVLGTVRLTDNIMAKVGDESVRDSVRGTYVWTHQRLTCPDTISQIYRGPMKFYVNSSDPNMEGRLAVLEKDDQIAGLELSESFSLCHSAAWMTHVRDIVVVIHGDNYTSVAKNGFDASLVSEAASVESQLHCTVNAVHHADLRRGSPQARDHPPGQDRRRSHYAIRLPG